VADGLEVADVRTGVPLLAGVGDELVGTERAQPLGLRRVAHEVEAGAPGGVHEVLARQVDGDVLLARRDQWSLAPPWARYVRNQPSAPLATSSSAVAA